MLARGTTRLGSCDAGIEEIKLELRVARRAKAPEVYEIHFPLQQHFLVEVELEKLQLLPGT